MAFNHTAQLILLTLKPDGVEGLSVPREIPGNVPGHVENVIECDLESASQKLYNALLYRGYWIILEHGEQPVPPTDLPQRIEQLDEEYAHILREAVDCYDQIKRDELPESEGILTLARLVTASNQTAVPVRNDEIPQSEE